ncbi:MAG TPA: type II toxin-antitoxin system HicA family toxin [Solirubrobacterales bacterium]|nr:type II toxin-antitoxin system HicA family toxin [Solirubrobacterales bacterium]
MKVRDIIKIIERNGWYQVRQRGSHRHYKHPSKPGLVTIPGKRSQDLYPEMVASILRQAGLKR